jgi:hypothetical protein
MIPKIELARIKFNDKEYVWEMKETTYKSLNTLANVSLLVIAVDLVVGWIS